MDIDKLFNVNQVPDALFDSVNNTVSEARALQKKKAAENAQAVISSLQKMKGDLEGKYDDLYGMLERRISSIQDGRDGVDGRDGRNGRDGKDGKDGASGRDGLDGIDGVNGIDGADGISIADIRLDFDNSLVITLSNGREINAGEILPPDITDRLKIIINQGASGGGSGGSLPDQSGNSGKYLTTDGVNASWASVGGGGGGIDSVASADGSVTVTTVSGAVDLSVATAASTTTVLVPVRNTTGATLTKGTAVYISGATGQISTVTKASASGDSTSAQTLGLMTANLANNSNGYVTVIGSITNLNTSAYTDGQQLYLSTTAGTLTATKPYAPTHLVYIAVVEHAHPTQGKLFVKIQNGYEMDELHNVSAQNPTNGQTLIYNETTSLWEKANLTAGTGISVTNAAGSITIATTGGGSSGDVVGPASSTDNAVARFDGTTGKLIQNSSFAVNDSGEVTVGVWKGTEITVPYGGTGVSTITGIIKGNGASAFSAATAGTDYLVPPSGTALLKANSGGALANATAGTDYLAPPSGTALLKANSGGALANAVSGTDYAPATSGSSILYGNGAGGFSNVTVGTGLTFTTGTLSATSSGGSSIGLVRAIAINCILP